MTFEKIRQIRTRLKALDAERSELERALILLEQKQDRNVSGKMFAADPTTPTISASSSSDAKLALFRQLFAGRTDVFPRRWDNNKTGRSGYSPACANEWAKGICGKPRVKCGECAHQAFLPVTDDMLASHLQGKDRKARSGGSFVAGVYPLLADGTCWFVAADFDKQNWAEDARAYLETCHRKNLPAALERSRSGKGGHVWIFSAPVPARIARQLGAAIITETMERRPEIGFASYDRLFPSQDTMPLGGFGNLIALPLQRGPREHGNSVFVDENLRPYDDQWAFLSSLPRLAPELAAEIAAEAEQRGAVLSVRMPVEDENAAKPWLMPASHGRRSERIEEPLPGEVHVVAADQLYIDRSELPPAMVARLIRLAAFQNPEFYRA